MHNDRYWVCPVGGAYDLEWFHLWVLQLKCLLVVVETVWISSCYKDFLPFSAS